MSFENQLRAALTTKTEALTASPVEVLVTSLPKRKPMLGTVIYGADGKIAQIILEPLAEVRRDADGEIESVIPQR